jgi:ATP-dependent Zn protease
MNVMNAVSNINNTDISVAFNLSDTPLQYIGGSRLKEIYLGEEKRLERASDDQEKKKDKTREMLRRFSFFSNLSYCIFLII